MSTDKTTTLYYCTIYLYKYGIDLHAHRMDNIIKDIEP